MGVVEQSCAAVEASLSALDRTYGSFSVNQTTLAVASPRYEREREQAMAGRVEVHTKVRNDQGEVLHVQDDDTLELPSATVTEQAFESAATAAVTEETGIECHVTGIEQATILGIRDADDESREMVYRLLVVFEAVHSAGTVAEEAVWHQTAAEPEPVYV